MKRTWDGLPVAQDHPQGAMVVVRRAGAESGAEAEYLMLHRAHRGPGYEGDWAWTPPSGARLPGEPVLAGAARELGEEAGLTAALRPVDLSGQWAVFAADVPAGTEARLDAEHDRFDWLPAAQAERRCRPDVVAASFRRGAVAPAPALAFRPLARTDLAGLVGWMHAPHAVRWFPEDLDLAAAERKYGPRIDGRSPTRVHVALIGGRAAGFAQHYRLRDYPAVQAACGGVDAIGIDYLIGEAGLTGRGIGPQLIWAYLQQVVFGAWPAARQVVASPQTANRRSVRVLEKAGFSRARVIAGEQDDRPELLCVLDRQRIFGRAG
ncbi:MAG TPA: GNAT family N-acetyltransferase [Streptosporangiaceae bacterium]